MGRGGVSGGRGQHFDDPQQPQRRLVRRVAREREDPFGRQASKSRSAGRTPSPAGKPITDSYSGNRRMTSHGNEAPCHPVDGQNSAQ